MTRSPEPSVVVAAPLRLEAHALRRGAPELRVVRTGVGPVRSRRAVAGLRRVRARALAVAGLCGALDPDLAPGDVVVASKLLAPDGGERSLDADALADAVRALGLRPRIGPLLGVDRLVRGGERDRLRRTGALAVDMESPWLAAAADGRPLAVLRVVLDGPDDELLRLALVRNGLRALGRLRAAAPALARWGAELARSAAPDAPVRPARAAD